MSRQLLILMSMFLIMSPIFALSSPQSNINSIFKSGSNVHVYSVADATGSIEGTICYVNGQIEASSAYCSYGTVHDYVEGFRCDPAPQGGLTWQKRMLEECTDAYPVCMDRMCVASNDTKLVQYELVAGIIIIAFLYGIYRLGKSRGKRR